MPMQLRSSSDHLRELSISSGESLAFKCPTCGVWLHTTASAWIWMTGGRLSRSSWTCASRTGYSLSETARASPADSDHLVVRASASSNSGGAVSVCKTGQPAESGRDAIAPFPSFLLRSMSTAVQLPHMSDGKTSFNIEAVMLYEFIALHRDEIIRRCQSKVATRSVPPPTQAEMTNGVPLFLDQLADALRHGELSSPEIGRSAMLHGHDLREQGFTVSQVVHGYGDVCQSITELAMEMRAPISADDFRLLNACLDDAIAVAVTEFAREGNQSATDAETARGSERLGFLPMSSGTCSTRRCSRSACSSRATSASEGAPVRSSSQPRVCRRPDRSLAGGGAPDARRVQSGADSSSTSSSKNSPRPRPWLLSRAGSF